MYAIRSYYVSYDVFSEPIEQLRKETDNRASTREVVRAIAKMPLIAEPGTRYSYGLGHDRNNFV